MSAAGCYFSTALLLLAGSPVAQPEDWPQWRGPYRDGVLSPAAAPASWPEHLQAKWKITVGEGHSSPIFSGGRIFVFTRQQGKEVASSIDPETGKLLWHQGYAAPYTMNPAAAQHGEGPKSTPVFDDGRLYTFGISGILTCWDAATGAVRWRKDFAKQYRQTSPVFGTAMSPIVDHGLLIAHVGGDGNGALSAFDAASGAVKWQWAGDGPAYASPIIVELAGSRQIVTETQSNIVGVSAADGRLLWKIPFSTDYAQNIPTPLVHGDLLILSGLAKGIMGVPVGVKDAKWYTETVWHNTDNSLYMSSPVTVGDLVFGFSHYKRGTFFCLDVKTGVTRWTSPPRQGDNAAVVVAGENLVLLKDDGELIVAKSSGKAFEPLRRYTVAESPTWAHPLVLRKGVVIKDRDTLALWSAERTQP